LWGNIAVSKRVRCGLLPLEFYARPATQVAIRLLGKNLVSLLDGQLTAGRIVETEAYLPTGDPACHASRGRTRGNAAMFGPAGRAYVYPIHSRHCFNVVVQQVDEGAAILVRAVQPTTGVDVMMQRRGISNPRDLCRGPARLCEAFGIDRRLDGHDLTRGQRVWIDAFEAVEYDEHQVRVSERIGVTSAADLPLRFVVAGCRYASGPLRLR
jgi:DNA-3-methyladenine glycosylase